MNFIIFFNFFIRLFHIHDSNHEFDRLTQVTQVFFSLFLIFFNFIIQYWVNWELSFVIYFGLFSMKLSSSHDSGYEFGRLFFMLFFNILFSIVSSNIELIENWVLQFISICFLLGSRSHDPSCGCERLNWIDSNYFFRYFLIDFFSISSLNIEFIRNWTS
jgi:hypothetical protein